MEEIYTPENRKNEFTKTHLSTSGKYQLTIELYEITDNHRSVSRGIVKRLYDNKDIFEIKRNYWSFPYLFFNRNGDEWLICGRKYLTQSFINLDKEKEYERHVESCQNFCWTGYSISPDGDTMAVDGCIWAAPYEYRFFDISDIEGKGWPELICNEFLYIDDWVDDESDGIGWNDDNTFTWKHNREWSTRFDKSFDDLTKVEFDQSNESLADEIEYVTLEYKTLKPEDGKMVVIDEWKKA